MNRIRKAIINLCTMCLAAFAFASLSSCTNEDNDSGMASLHVSAFAYERPSVTRAATGYEDFASVYSATPETPLAMNYWICLGTTFQVSQTATYNGSTWTSYCNLESSATPYEFYSFMPGSIITNHGVSATLNSSVSPAVMTFTGIPAVIGEDVIISEAVTSGKTETTNPFDQEITSASDQAVTFRMQHVLAKVSFSFSNPTGKSFTDMRKIVVRRLELYPETNGSKHDVACTMGQTITYAWTPQTPGPTDNYFINDDTEFTINGKQAYGYLVEQSATKAYCSCYMVPFDNNNIKIRVVYDVYASDGTLIRDNEISVNNNLTISNTSKVVAGKEYKINVNIIPDYLYMLSDVDAGTSLEIKTN